MLKNTSLPAGTPVKEGLPVSSQIFSRVVTNDLYFAAYLLCEGYELDRVYHNGRGRVAFEFAGEGILEKKKAYKKGRVFLNVGSFRDKLKSIRGIAYGQERSHSCPTLPHMQAQA